MLYATTQMETVTCELSRDGLRGLRQTLRQMGFSKRFARLAIADALLFRPWTVDVEFSNVRIVRIVFSNHTEGT